MTQIEDKQTRSKGISNTCPSSLLRNMVACNLARLTHSQMTVENHQGEYNYVWHHNFMLLPTADRYSTWRLATVASIRILNCIWEPTSLRNRGVFSPVSFVAIPKCKCVYLQREVWLAASWMPTILLKKGATAQVAHTRVVKDKTVQVSGSQTYIWCKKLGSSV